MAHRPPLPKRWRWFSVIAFFAPPVVLQLVPSENAPYRDLVWLLTLVPAYLLSLQYGMRGAVAALTIGTALFTAIQLLAAFNLDPADWRITVPIYVAYSAITISVGWLSQRMNLYYERAIQGERMAVITEVGVAIRHEINNALATLMAEAQLLEGSGRINHAEDREALLQIRLMTRRLFQSVDKLTRLTSSPVTEDVDGVSMADLDQADVGDAATNAPARGS
jgi:signal transduction histidine kinase